MNKIKTSNSKGDMNQNDDMMTPHNKEAAEMIHHHPFMICILIVTLLASTNLSIIAPFIAGLILISRSDQPAIQRRAELDFSPVTLIQVLRHRIRGGVQI